MPVKTIEWVGDHIRIIDQTCLPEKLVYLDIDQIDRLAEAISMLRIRGAPAIGIAGAMGVAMVAAQYQGKSIEELLDRVRDAILILRKTRPTAVNLFWALDRMDKSIREVQKYDSVEACQNRFIQMANAIFEDDRRICRKMGENGSLLISQSMTILTHCNAGGLATADYGTALGVIYRAHEQGKQIKVYADETRPLLQGARLTAWELLASGIDITVICDSAAAFLMQQGKIDCVLVGADRIAINGDTANKIGTYNLAVIAEKHHIPFYVVAPISTFDFTLLTGEEIPIEERNGDEVAFSFNKRSVPQGVSIYNPAFDITPHKLIRAFITEKGILNPPFNESINTLK